MNIVMVWGQRKCRYIGQYAPELLEAVDEHTNNDNPEIIDNAYTRALESQEFLKVRIAEGLISSRFIKDMFERPKTIIANKDVR